MKDLKISNLLLSEVLGHDDICNERIIQNKLLYMCKNDGMDDYVYEYNIYEFASMCKEWAYSTYGIMIQSYPYCGKSRADALKGLEVDEVFKENTEVEAIIQACEWILEYKKNQCTK